MNSDLARGPAWLSPTVCRQNRWYGRNRFERLPTASSSISITVGYRVCRHPVQVLCCQWRHPALCRAWCPSQITGLHLKPQQSLPCKRKGIGHKQLPALVEWGCQLNTTSLFLLTRHYSLVTLTDAGGATQMSQICSCSPAMKKTNCSFKLKHLVR